MADGPVQQALQFLRDNPRAVLSTLRPDGRPAMSPVLAAVDAQDRVVISTRETAYKVKQLRADPRIAVCALSGGFFGEWHQLEGRPRSSRYPRRWSSWSTTTSGSAASTTIGRPTGRACVRSSGCWCGSR